MNKKMERRIYLPEGYVAKLIKKTGYSRTTIDKALKWEINDESASAKVKTTCTYIRKLAKEEYEGKYLIQMDGLDAYLLCTTSDQLKGKDHVALKAIIEKTIQNTIKNKDKEGVHYE